MNSFTDVYKTFEQFNPAQNSLRYFFISKGKKDIIKAVDYTYVGDFNGLHLYNLGFGDYDPVNGEISDNSISDNNDQYKVFHTVLHTVPMMFDALGQVSLIVEGSDSRPEFIEKCKTECNRNCETGACKKAHRRIAIYRGFVDKNYDKLQENYIFYGGEYIGNQNIIEPFQKGKKYKKVFCSRKKV
jgi:hypothetical protein